MTYQSEEFINAVEVREWECGKSLNDIAAKQGITIRRNYHSGYGSKGTTIEKEPPRNILEQIIWDKEVEVAQVLHNFFSILDKAFVVEAFSWL